jgi:hypothetical protein
VAFIGKILFLCPCRSKSCPCFYWKGQHQIYSPKMNFLCWKTPSQLDFSSKCVLLWFLYLQISCMHFQWRLRHLCLPNVIFYDPKVVNMREFTGRVETASMAPFLHHTRDLSAWSCGNQAHHRVMYEPILRLEVKQYMICAKHLVLWQ